MENIFEEPEILISSLMKMMGVTEITIPKEISDSANEYIIVNKEYKDGEFTYSLELESH